MAHTYFPAGTSPQWLLQTRHQIFLNELLQFQHLEDLEL